MRAVLENLTKVFQFLLRTQATPPAESGDIQIVYVYTRQRLKSHGWDAAWEEPEKGSCVAAPAVLP